MPLASPASMLRSLRSRVTPRQPAAPLVLTGLYESLSGPTAAGGCPYCPTPLVRANAQGMRVSSRDARWRQCHMSIALSVPVEALVCTQCRHAFSSTPAEHAALDAAVAASWAIRLRRKFGIRWHADDAIGLGITWARHHDCRPLELYLFGQCLAIGSFHGDEPRVSGYHLWGAWRILADLITSEAPPTGPRPEVITWHAGIRTEGGPFGRRDRFNPAFVGLGVSLVPSRWQGGSLSLAVVLHLGPWKAWVQRSALARRRARPRRRRVVPAATPGSGSEGV